MKKLFKTFAVLAIASAALITSCKDEVDPSPVTITVSGSPSDKTLSVGTNLTLTLELKGNSDNKLKSVKVTTNKTSAPLLDKQLDGTDAIEVVKQELNQVGAWVFTVSLEGAEGTVTSSYEVTVTTPTSYNAFGVESTEIPLGAQSSSFGQFIDINDGVVHEFGNGQAKANAPTIDFGYAFASNDNAATLFGPSHTAYNTAIYNTPADVAITSWTVRNATKVARLTNVTPVDYAAAINDSIIVFNASALANATENRVTKLAVGDVLVFETGRNIGATHKKGLILVTEVNVGGTGSIKIKRKIQQ